MKNTYGCNYQYICATVLYLLSILSHAYNFVIGRCFGGPRHGKGVIDGLNATDRRFLYNVDKTVQLTSAATNNSQMVIHTEMSNTYISLVRVFQNHLSDPISVHRFIDNGKYRKLDSKRKWKEHEYHVKDRKNVQPI